MPYFTREEQIKKNLKKLVDYSHELAQFAIGLRQEGNDFNGQEISDQVKELVQIAQQIHQSSKQIQKEVNKN